MSDTDTTIVACPHCGRELRRGGGAHEHIRSCLDSPDVRERVRAALTAPGNPGMARTQVTYTAIAQATDAPSREALARRYGSWARACEAFGLRSTRQPTRPNGVSARQCEVRAIAEVDAALEDDAALREYWDGGRGLPVLDTPRRLADGRVAWMVR